jgi:hypothetical protein
VHCACDGPNNWIKERSYAFYPTHLFHHPFSLNLIVVADRSQADFEINGFAESQKAGWAKIIFKSGLPESEASIQMVNLRSAVVAYAVASYKVDARNGNKSTAEHLAKNLRQKMERDEKRLLTE